MKYFVRIIFVMLLLSLFSSCDELDDLLSAEFPYDVKLHSLMPASDYAGGFVHAEKCE